jgi:hypothetical protein
MKRGGGRCSRVEWFRALEQTRDPVKAFKRFCAWVGVDPLAARDRGPAALARLSVAIVLLHELAALIVELAALTSLLSEAADRRIGDALRDTTGPDPLSRLRDYAAQAEATAELLRIAGRMEELPPCALAARTRAIIRDMTVNPFATARADIEDGVRAARRLEAALRL